MKSENLGQQRVTLSTCLFFIISQTNSTHNFRARVRTGPAGHIIVVASRSHAVQKKAVIFRSVTENERRRRRANCDLCLDARSERESS